MIGSGGNRRISITKVSLDLMTLVKGIEQKVEGLEAIVEQMEMLERNNVATIMIGGNM
jgi:hypothetical protein